METPIDKSTIPHDAIDTVIKWLGIGYETTVTRASDRAKIRVRITMEEKAAEKDAELKMLREFHEANVTAHSSAALEHETETKPLPPSSGATCSFSSFSAKVMVDDQGSYYIHPVTGDRVNMPKEGWRRDKLAFRPLKPEDSQPPADPSECP